jgi:hypothetical protein
MRESSLKPMVAYERKRVHACPKSVAFASFCGGLELLLYADVFACSCIHIPARDWRLTALPGLEALLADYRLFSRKASELHDLEKLSAFFGFMGYVFIISQ